VQSLAAHTFYKTLKELSGTEGILSQNQPGFFYGNLKSETNPSEKVVGFFEVSSVASKRMFFNYVDLFPGEVRPPYYTECKEEKLLFCFGPSDECSGTDIIYALEQNTYVYFYQDISTYYHWFPTPCGDCTSFSSNIKPPFWIN
jgi:hypothetical protein